MQEEDVTQRPQSPDNSFQAQAKLCLAAARKALYRWAEAASSGRLEELLALYAPDAILVPTVSNEVGGHDEERRRYFADFLANPKLHCRIDTLKKRVSHKLGTVVVGGLYTFSYERDGQTEVVPARYLFTFEEIDGRGLITGHHSSRLSSAL